MQRRNSRLTQQANELVVLAFYHLSSAIGIYENLQPPQPTEMTIQNVLYSLQHALSQDAYLRHQWRSTMPGFPSYAPHSNPYPLRPARMADQIVPISLPDPSPPPPPPTPPANDPPTEEEEEEITADR